MSTRDLDTPPQPTSELPPFVFVPVAGGSTVPSEGPVATEPPQVGDTAPRRWSTGHTVAAAVVVVGVLASGGVALAARDTAGTGVEQLPGGGGFGQPPGGPGGRGGFGQLPAPPGQGQLPGQGRLGGPGQLPGGGNGTGSGHT